MKNMLFQLTKKINIKNYSNQEQRDGILDIQTQQERTTHVKSIN